MTREETLSRLSTRLLSWLEGYSEISTTDMSEVKTLTISEAMNFMELCSSITGNGKLRNFVHLLDPVIVSDLLSCEHWAADVAWDLLHSASGINIDKVVMQISTHSSADVRILVLFRLCRTIDPHALGCALTQSSVSAALRALLTAPSTAAEVGASHKRVRTCRDGVISGAGTARQPPFESMAVEAAASLGWALGCARHGQTDSDCHCTLLCHARRDIGSVCGTSFADHVWRSLMSGLQAGLEASVCKLARACRESESAVACLLSHIHSQRRCPLLLPLLANSVCGRNEEDVAAVAGAAVTLLSRLTPEQRCMFVLQVANATTAAASDAAAPLASHVDVPLLVCALTTRCGSIAVPAHLATAWRAMIERQCLVGAPAVAAAQMEPLLLPLCTEGTLQTRRPLIAALSRAWPLLVRTDAVTYVFSLIEGKVTEGKIDTAAASVLLQTLLASVADTLTEIDWSRAYSPSVCALSSSLSVIHGLVMSQASDSEFMRALLAWRSSQTLSVVELLLSVCRNNASSASQTVTDIVMSVLLALCKFDQAAADFVFAVILQGDTLSMCFPSTAQHQAQQQQQQQTMRPQSDPLTIWTPVIMSTLKRWLQRQQLPAPLDAVTSPHALLLLLSRSVRCALLQHPPLQAQSALSVASWLDATASVLECPPLVQHAETAVAAAPLAAACATALRDCAKDAAAVNQALRAIGALAYDARCLPAVVCGDVLPAAAQVLVAAEAVQSRANAAIAIAVLVHEALAAGGSVAEQLLQQTRALRLHLMLATTLRSVASLEGAVAGAHVLVCNVIEALHDLALSAGLVDDLRPRSSGLYDALQTLLQNPRSAAFAGDTLTFIVPLMVALWLPSVRDPLGGALARSLVQQPAAVANNNEALVRLLQESTGLQSHRGLMHALTAAASAQRGK